MPDNLIHQEKLLRWTIAAFIEIGISSNHAEIISNALINTSLWGIDSHGIARIPHYLRRFENGTIKINPVLKFIRTGYSTGQLDGDDGHGIVVMTEAADHAINVAKEAGAAIIGVQNSSHCGAIGLYTRQITQADMIGIAFTHSDALVIPFGGNKAFFGTNPLSFAFPTENLDEPICADMATSIAPWNLIMNARQTKQSVKSGVGVDTEGKDTTDPDNIVALKPLGKHKGYVLAFIIDMLCGPLNGMPYGPNITSMYKDLDKKRKLGSLVIAIDPERFGGRNSLQKTGTYIINMIKKQNVEILFPGEPEYIKRNVRLKNGIPVSSELLSEFNYLSENLGIQPPI